jgi:hypothetical protein
MAAKRRNNESSRKQVRAAQSISLLLLVFGGKISYWTFGHHDPWWTQTINDKRWWTHTNTGVSVTVLFGVSLPVFTDKSGVWSPSLPPQLRATVHCDRPSVHAWEGPKSMSCAAGAHGNDSEQSTPSSPTGVGRGNRRRAGTPTKPPCALPSVLFCQVRRELLRSLLLCHDCFVTARAFNSTEWHCRCYSSSWPRAPTAAGVAGAGTRSFASSGGLPPRGSPCRSRRPRGLPRAS